MIYNDRMGNPLGHFSYKNCPNTALMLSKALFAQNERTAKTLIVVVKLPIIFCFHCPE